MRRFPPTLILLATTGACAHAPASVRSLPAHAGIEVRYAAPPETVVAALPGALEARGFGGLEHAAWDSATTAVFATRRNGAFSTGAYLRVLAGPGSDQAAAIRVAAGPRERKVVGTTDRVTPRVVQSLDAALGPGALGPFAGDHIRGRDTTADNRLARGLVVAGPDGALLVARQGRPAAPITSFTDVAIERGRYGHQSEGAMVGVLVGLAAGWVVVNNATFADMGEGVAAGVLVPLAGGVVGMITGMIVGGSIQTTVWSEVR